MAIEQTKTLPSGKVVFRNGQDAYFTLTPSEMRQLVWLIVKIYFKSLIRRSK